jgi:hypothetical protein
VLIRWTTPSSSRASSTWDEAIKGLLEVCQPMPA